MPLIDPRPHRLTWLALLTVTAVARCGSAVPNERTGADAPVAATPCRGGQVARIADPSGNVVNDLRPGQRSAFPGGLDLRAVALVATEQRVCATWRLAAPPLSGTFLILLLYRARYGGGGVAVEIDVRLTGRSAEVAAGGYGDDGDEFRSLYAEVRRRGDQVTAVIPSRQLPAWSPRPSTLVWAAITRDVVHGLPLTDRAPSRPIIGLRYITGRPCEATALRC